MLRIPKPLILASRSPRRSQLLRQIGIPFSISESDVEEVLDPSTTPEENVARLSLRKAESVAAKESDVLVVGADTIVVLNGRRLGKPADDDEAMEMLRFLGGHTHTVYTGFAIVDAQSGKKFADSEHTDVTFRPIGEEEIREYVKSGSPMDKAGAYGIQDDYGAVFVERIAGCYYTVVGFPLAKFYMSLQRFLEQLT